MNNTPNGYSADRLQNVVRTQELEPLSNEDGFRWGLSHIEYVKKELLQLEERALIRHDIELLYEITASKLRAREVEEELRKKLSEIKNETDLAL